MCHKCARRFSINVYDGVIHNLYSSDINVPDQIKGDETDETKRWEG